VPSPIMPGCETLALGGRTGVAKFFFMSKAPVWSSLANCEGCLFV
jgi:hypothetical protein